MDTHIASSPDLDRHDLHLSARLPGEPDLDSPANGAPEPQEKLAPVEVSPRRKGRGLLLGGVATIALLSIAAGVFVVSPYNHVVAVSPKVLAAVHTIERNAGFKRDAPLAPSASLASVAVPPRPASVELPKYKPQPRGESLSEILRMRSGNGSETGAAQATVRAPLPAARVATPSAPGGFVPHEPGMPGSVLPVQAVPAVALPAKTAPVSHSDASAKPRQPNDITASIIKATEGHPETAGEHALPSKTAPAPIALAVQPVETPVQSVVAPVQKAVLPAVPAPHVDAAARAQHLVAGPMTSDEQAKVLELITQMATIVHDQKAQIGALRADFAKTKIDDQARLADFARRVDLAEATRAVAAAAGSDAPATSQQGPSTNTATARPPTAMKPVAVTRAAAAVPGTQDLKHYRVQAASPGLALLAEVERGGGDGAQLQVVVGGSIPGYGRVKSISQTGSSWAVRTEHGDIR